jgi:hypothetical protein
VLASRSEKKSQSRQRRRPAKKKAPKRSRTIHHWCHQRCSCAINNWCSCATNEAEGVGGMDRMVTQAAFSCARINEALPERDFLERGDLAISLSTWSHLHELPFIKM